VQFVTTLLPKPECVCAGHSTQDDTSKAAALTLNVPAEHGWQNEEPFTALYVPAGHATHASPSLPEYPFTQVQFVTTLLPKSDCVCAGHATHSDALTDPSPPLKVPAGHCSQSSVPFTALYVPTRHARQSSSWLPVYPARHMQSVAALLMDGDVEPLAQGVIAPPSHHESLGQTVQLSPSGP
jgi:hypothetical protein